VVRIAITVAKNPSQHLLYFMHRLRRLKHYIDFSETNWKDRLAMYNRSLEDDNLNLKSFGGRRDYWADLADEFPEYHRKASFLMVFAMLEDDLTQFCKAIATEQKLTTPLTDASGKGIERAKFYLTKVARFAFPASTIEWQTIKSFGDVRNVLIHASGHLEPRNGQHERAKKFAQRRRSGLRVRNHARSQITFEPEFLPSMIATLEKFYELLLAETNRPKP
jgi:hypothetical protein